ncbi:FKBP-type peptidyl-prolyl cis-trans isomerase [Candidatus Woesearchaeota archaeon]|nr:FKBP-type peptidyl-prolyl cis-trans isomerase [Candidatus Woesearchaeota archaeon]
MADTVQKGDRIRILYVAKKEDGTIFDYTPKEKPIEFTVGSKQVLSGIDVAVEGMIVGERRSFQIAPDNAFGYRNEELKQVIPRKALPAEIEVKEGKVISVKTQKGFQFQAVITQFDDENVTLDMNHPLAGHTITFEIQVLGKVKT